MRKVKIITDSCSDLGQELLEKYDIDYAPMRTVLDGVESPALLTWSDAEAHELYETIRGGKRVTTTQVPAGDFEIIFKKYLSEGYDIVYIACSSKQSGSVNTGYVTAQRLLADYPDVSVYCIDSLNASLGEGMLAVEAAKCVAKGMSADEINKYILSIRNNVNQFATVHTLEHLKKAGRVSASGAFFGNLIGVKPIIISDANGVQTAIKKVKGRQKSFSEIVACLKEKIVNAEEQTIYIAHGDCSEDELSALVSLVKREIPAMDYYVGYIGPIIGASIGPDAVSVWGFGEAVTHKAE